MLIDAAGLRHGVATVMVLAVRRRGVIGDRAGRRLRGGDVRCRVLVGPDDVVHEHQSERNHEERETPAPARGQQRRRHRATSATPRALVPADHGDDGTEADAAALGSHGGERRS
ncbi:hypothetical protein PGB27_12475 [Actinomycetospora sp. DW7H6]|uniref:Uncharacterized protein n=1 Tax=Actinomycetospora lemnae TaxID=3019891 RepID=A0ABT5SUM5_9PSEU|nr:hypothetical protein [Actinomycetospora sp. DW7H6]MDD7966155.1 hypothetical protein [Actinomycetospora sp. DW7H6]